MAIYSPTNPSNSAKIDVMFQLHLILCYCLHR